MNSEAIFEKQILIFMSKKALNFDNCHGGFSVELGSANALAHIIFPTEGEIDPEVMEKAIINDVYRNYCIGEIMQQIAKF